MAGRGSFLGRLLRIDLTNRTSRVEELGEEVLGRFLGGRGLGAWLLYHELRPGVDPLGPENKLIFSTGPLTGTAAPGSSKYVITTKSPLTGIYLMSISSRDLARQIKQCGFDALIIEGKASRPSYLLIRDGRVEIRDASHLWGTTTGDAEKIIHADAGQPKPGVACIGPAGERMLPYACVINDGGRAAGRGGAGAVMGSKNLKALAVAGTGKVAVADPAAFRQALQQAYQEIEAHPYTPVWRAHGTFASVPANHGLGIMPVQNWRRNRLEGVESLTGDYMRENHLVKATRCAPCTIACSKLCLVKDGPYAGVTSEGPEYETIYSFGSSCGITDLASIIYADNFCDRYGVDTMSAGISVSFLMECFERGLLSKADAGGMEPRFGAAHLLPRLLHDLVNERGLGRYLARGTRWMASQIGQGSEDFAMQAKGMELGGYDPRSVKGMALVYACGPRGGCHHAGGRPIQEEVKSGSQLVEAGKGQLVKDSRENRVLFDCAVVCTFTPLSHDNLAALLSAATGAGFAGQTLYAAADRTSNVERLFNVREGLRRVDDTLPGRLLKEPVSEGPSRGETVNLPVMLDDFYAACGWDQSTGIPSPAKLSQLGLEALLTGL